MNLSIGDAVGSPYLGARGVSASAPRDNIFQLWKTLVWHVDVVATATATVVLLPKIVPFIERIRITCDGVECPVSYYCRTTVSDEPIGPLTFEQLAHTTGRSELAEPMSSGFCSGRFGHISAHIEADGPVRIEILAGNLIITRRMGHEWSWYVANASSRTWRDDGATSDLSTEPPPLWHAELMERLAALPTEAVS